jgi:hypothetical protein
VWVSLRKGRPSQRDRLWNFRIQGRPPTGGRELSTLSVCRWWATKEGWRGQGEAVGLSWEVAGKSLEGWNHQQGDEARSRRL